MKLQIASYELAKLAKEKGFNWITRTYYDREDQTVEEFVYYEFDQWDYINEFEKSNHNFTNFDEWCLCSKPEFLAPPLDLLCKWFRDVHKIVFSVDVYHNGETAFMLFTEENQTYFTGKMSTYEAAQEAALFKAFELI